MDNDKRIPEELLSRYITGHATDAEIKEVMQWAEENPGNLRELQMLRRLNDEAVWNTELEAGKSHKSSRKAVIGRVASWAAAASILLLIGFSVSFLLYGPLKQEPSMSVYAPLGQRTGLTLADGTHIWLNSGSCLEVYKGFNNRIREVKLDGEGYFTVAKNEDKPFVVHTKSYSIKVLGTEFNVSAYAVSSEWSVALVAGKVEIYGDKSNVVLAPNMKAEDIGGELVTSEFTDYDAFLWRKGIMAFEDASFSDIFSKLETYFQVSFRVSDSKLLDRRSTCKFVTSDGIECIMKILLMGENLSYEFDADKRIITIR